MESANILMQKIDKLTNFSKYILSLLFGAITVFSFAPFFIFPALILGFSAFFVILDSQKTLKESFLAGWFFAFGHFVAGLYWISYSLLVDAGSFAWLIPFAISLIPAVLAIYTGFVCVITNIAMRDSSLWKKAIFFSSLWVLFEVLRSYLFAGFPWNLMGYSFLGVIEVAQFAKILGVYGLSFLAVLIGVIPALFIVKRGAKFSPAIIVILLISAIYFWGQEQINTAKYIEREQAVNLRIVQPNIAQTMKINPKKTIEAFLKHIDLTQLESEEGAQADIVIWPESVLPFFLDREQEIRKIMANSLKDGAILITGAVRGEMVNGEQKIWNSVQVVDSKSAIVASYDKHKLVPFGEFVPFRKIFPFINKVTPGSVDFSRGEGAKTLKINDYPAFSPLICYEAIFPDQVASKENPPSWLVNVTNDGWFGDSTGPHQHFNMLKMRAIEEGIPAIRSANTGISAIIDAHGRVIKSLGINKEGVIDAQLPRQLSPESKGIYYKYGHNSALIISVILMLLMLILGKQKLDFKRSLN